MTFWDALLNHGTESLTAYLAVLLLVTHVSVRALNLTSTVRLKALGFFFAMHLVCLLGAASLHAAGSDLYRDFLVPARVFAGVAAVGMLGLMIFAVILPRIRVSTPRILQDVLIALASVAVSIVIVSRSGVNLSGLLATSAVATAAVGLALQDVIGNVAGGLALQLDNSVEVGDWVKLGDVNGQVTEIRWRYTAIETRNWETVIVPNSQLMKNQVSVLGRRTGKPRLWRRWVYFNVDYRFQPSDVIECVSQALHAAKIDRMAMEPLPNCVLIDLAESYGRYAVRYWLKDLAVDDPTDSEVRTVVFFALQRAGMRLSIPAHAIFVTEESADRAALKTEKETNRRAMALSHVELFASLSEAERAKLVRGLRYAPFSRGEILTRQGAEAHWLYLLDEGEVSIRVGEGSLEREVARLKGGSFFGEMSLMTGEARSATVVALTDVECFRLDKATFQEVLQQRPEIAEHLAKVLAKRKVELSAARGGLDQDAAARRLGGEQGDLLNRIRGFFGLG
ncbi:MAG: mechanosensitive ion channel [Myxococcaceae bacterium]|nr:mechanosensitive ion channel [Myxococcaceae bacterium]